MRDGDRERRRMRTREGGFVRARARTFTRQGRIVGRGRVRRCVRVYVCVGVCVCRGPRGVWTECAKRPRGRARVAEKRGPKRADAEADARTCKPGGGIGSARHRLRRRRRRNGHSSSPLFRSFPLFLLPRRRRSADADDRAGAAWGEVVRRRGNVSGTEIPGEVNSFHQI